MTLDLCFLIANNLALLAWLGLGVALFLRVGPWRRRLLILTGRVVPLVLASGYVVGLVVFLSSGAPQDGTSLSGVMGFFALPLGALIAWVHFLVFDLFVGHWIVTDSEMRAIRPGWVLPILFLTLMFGPVGLLSYFGVRSWVTRQPA
jgi:hypothetical protein